MQNNRLFQVFFLMLAAGGVLLVVRGLRHPPPSLPVPVAATPAPRPAEADTRGSETAVTAVTAALSPAVTVEAPATGPARPPSTSSLPTAAGEPAPAAPAERTPPPSSIRRVSVAEFLSRPERLDRHPMEVGRCRLVEHWDTGYCYVFSLSSKRKISQPDDARCEDLPELRRRMRAAVESGECR